MKKAFIILLTCVLSVFIASCNTVRSTTKYNENPDLSKKVVGSKNLTSAVVDPIKTMEELVGYSEYIIIGNVLRDIKEEEVNPYGSDERGEEMKKQAEEIGQYVPLTVTVSKIKILEVLQGNLEAGMEIKLVEPGKMHTPDQ